MPALPLVLLALAALTAPPGLPTALAAPSDAGAGGDGHETDAGSGWRRALPGWLPEFPRDHFAHPDFKTEWWYFTGHLESAGGRRFGFQVTFFRQGVRAPGERTPVASRFVVDAFHFAHFALTDIAAGDYRHAHASSRGAFGEAGSAVGPADPPAEVSRVAWIPGGELTLDASGVFRVAATLSGAAGGFALDLAFTPRKPPVVNGIDGASRKGEALGNASHYYSMTRLATSGHIVLDGTRIPVSGTSWLDREWGTSQLGENDVGWDWFSLQLDDGTDLMLYQIRRADGSASPFSSGTFTDADGGATHLSADAFTLEPTDWWTSRATGARYPTAWRITLPALGLELETRPAVRAQEFTAPPVAYWEGAIEVRGSRTGRGYLELTGYAGAVPGISSSD